MNTPIWQLPVRGAERTGNGYINSRAKYHCFVDNHSLCDQYNQKTQDYDDGISCESGTIAQNPQYACAVCYNRWKKRYNIDV